MGNKFSIKFISKFPKAFKENIRNAIQLKIIRNAMNIRVMSFSMYLTLTKLSVMQYTGKIIQNSEIIVHSLSVFSV